MTNTLIVRDAIALVLGEAVGGADLEAHLRARVAAARSLDESQVRDCLEVVAPDAGEDAQPEVLATAFVLAAAHPRASAAHQLNAAVVGRRLSAAYERADDVDSAFAALRIASELVPRNAGLERAMASLMRRKGMVQELVERYLERAQQLLDEGEHAEAIPWLREVLALDRSRKDVARMIRDLRFDEVSSVKSRRRRIRIAGVALVLSLAASVGVLRELRLRADFESLPEAVPGNLATLSARLAAVEAFVAANPVWHGALDVLQERADLRVQIERVAEEEAVKAKRVDFDREQRNMMADGAVILARRHAEVGDFAAALQEFRRALSLSSESWSQRERTQRDVEALAKHLEEGGS